MKKIVDAMLCIVIPFYVMFVYILEVTEAVGEFVIDNWFDVFMFSLAGFVITLWMLGLYQLGTAFSEMAQ